MLSGGQLLHNSLIAIAITIDIVCRVSIETLD